MGLDSLKRLQREARVELRAALSSNPPDDIEKHGDTLSNLDEAGDLVNISHRIDVRAGRRATKARRSAENVFASEGAWRLEALHQAMNHHEQRRVARRNSAARETLGVVSQRDMGNLLLDKSRQSLQGLGDL